MELSSFDSFAKVVQEEVDKFPTVALAKKAQSQSGTMADYHKFLGIVFHQSFHAPASFALAAGSLTPERYEARDYLIKHSEEERTHWTWVLSDLEKTGYKGPDLRQQIPSPRVSAYIAFNFFMASRYPLGRLANAAVLEGIGATHAKKFAQLIAGQLKLTKEQLVFALGHSDTDIGHTQEIFDILKKCRLTNEEWAWLSHSARTSALLYRDMYNEE